MLQSCRSKLFKKKKAEDTLVPSLSLLYSVLAVVSCVLCNMLRQRTAGAITWYAAIEPDKKSKQNGNYLFSGFGETKWGKREKSLF